MRWKNVLAEHSLTRFVSERSEPRQLFNILAEVYTSSSAAVAARLLGAALFGKPDTQPIVDALEYAVANPPDESHGLAPHVTANFPAYSKTAWRLGWLITALLIESDGVTLSARVRDKMDDPELLDVVNRRYKHDHELVRRLCMAQLVRGDLDAVDKHRPPRAKSFRKRSTAKADWNDVIRYLALARRNQVEFEALQPWWKSFCKTLPAESRIVYGELDVVVLAARVVYSELGDVPPAEVVPRLREELRIK